MNAKLVIAPAAALGLAALLFAGTLDGRTADDVRVEATLTGKVVYDGSDIPERSKLDMNSKPEHAEHCLKASDQLDRSMIVNPDNKGIANVYVEIRKVTKDDWESDEVFVLDQESCRFEPHVKVVPAKSKVKFVNSDPFMHNVNLMCKKNSTANFGIPAEGDKVMEFRSSEKVGVRCDVHTWMSSWVVVTDNPFHALTDADGAFSIEGVPEGEYEVRFWHETLGSLKKKDVKIADGEMLEIKSSDSDWKD